MERAQKSLKASAKQPAKGKKAGPAKKGGEDEREETLQAVVLADSFETRFNPFTLEKPRCLLPLANVPLIEYTLEFLAMSGVSSIYVYCGAHTEEVEKYIHASKWNPIVSPASPFTTLEILKSAARSVGDALRDIDNRGLITGDFLLVHGDLVSNLPIDAALSAHRARRMADKNAIMTLILRDGGLGPHRTKSLGIIPVFIADPTKSRCVHYEEMNPLQANKFINIDPELISEHAELEIRTDLIDCGIDICTPDVLALWSDSFDYEVPRRHFLHGVLKDYELNGKTIHMEIISDNYAARVSTLQAYESVSKDVLGRWTYPLVPDSNLVSGQSYKLSRGGICKESGVILARSSKIGKQTILGQDTSIGDGSVVSNSIIGRKCQIGKNVTIRNAYIWDNVIVGDGCDIQRAIVASNASIGSKCLIQPGALISFGVNIAQGTTIKEGTRMTRAKRKRSSVSSNPLPSAALTEHSTIIVSGNGQALDSDSDSETDEFALQSTLIYNTAHLNLSASSISTLSSSVDSSGRHSPTPRSRLSSFAGSLSEDDGIASTLENFHKDAVADVFRTLSEAGDFRNTRVEFTSLRLSHNATDHAVRRAIATGFMKRVAQLLESGLDAARAVGQTLDQDSATSFLNDVAIGREKALPDQVDFLLCVQKDLLHRDRGDTLLAVLAKELYDRDVVEEEGLEGWWADARGSESEELRAVRKKAEEVVVWLREAEEEESEEEDESE